MVKSHNQEEKRFRRFDMHRMCKTIDMLAGMYSPEHPQRMRPPPLAIMYQPGLCKSYVAATSDLQSLGWYMMASGGGLKSCGCSGEYISASMSMVLHILCISNLLKRFSS